MLSEYAIQHYKRNFILGISNGIFFNIGLAFLSGSTVLPVFMAHLTDSKVLIGLATSIENIGWHLPQLFVAAATIHYSRQLGVYAKAAILRSITFLGIVVAVFALGEKNNDLLLVLFFFLFTFFAVSGGLAAVSFMDIVGKTIPANKRGTYFGMRMFIGGGLAALSGILVKKILGGYSFPTNFGLLFSLALVTVILGLGSFALVKEPILSNSRPHKSLKENCLEAFSLFQTDATYKLLFLVRIAIGSVTLAYPFYILYAQKTLNIKPEAAGIFLSFEMLGYLISNILWAYLSNRINNRLVLLLSAVCSVLPPVIALINSLFPLPLVLYALAFFFLGATNSGVFIGFFNYLLEIAPEEKRPLYVGFIHTVIFPTFLLSTLGGVIIQATSFNFLFALTLILGLVAVFLAYRLLKFKK
ncbi:MAG TPA: MFS transporter [candidate division Zixibacteria bacterium]|nr:MFS transporter [candidate division Zixibacteria bacterium]